MAERLVDTSPRRLRDWKEDVSAFREAYGRYLNATVRGRQHPDQVQALRSEVNRTAAPAQAVFNRIGADVGWDLRAQGGPLIRGLVATMFIHESVWGYSGSGMFSTGGEPWRGVLDVTENAIAALDVMERDAKKLRRRPIYWLDRGLGAVLGFPAYLISLVFRVSLEQIEHSPFATPLRLTGIVIDGFVVYFGGHALRWW